MVKKANKGKQEEFDGMPKRSALGKAGLEYLEAKDESDQAKEILISAAMKLSQEFRKAKKNKVSVEGRCISFNHIEKDLIRVKKTEAK